MSQEEPKLHDQSPEIILPLPAMSVESCPNDCGELHLGKLKTRARTDLLEGALTGKIIAAFYMVYNTFGFGLLEAVYANALAVELRARGLRVEREVPVDVFYRGQPVGRFRLDLVVEARVLVECKATELLPRTVRPQVFSYLKCSAYPIALLLHFGLSPRHFRYIRPDVLKQLAGQSTDALETDQPGANAS